MPGVLKSSVLTYEFSVQSLKELIAADLGKSLKDIDVEFVVSDIAPDSYGGGTNYQLTRVSVRVNQHRIVPTLSGSSS